MESSRDIPMMEIVIPFFAVKKKKKKAEVLSPLLFLKRTMKALCPKQLDLPRESRGLLLLWLLFKEANKTPISQQ